MNEKNAHQNVVNKLSFRMLRAVIVEDNTAELENILAFLAQLCPFVNVIGTAGEINEGVALITQTQPDLLLTDVQITGGDCYDLLEKLRTQKQLDGLSIIFMTGFHDFNNATQAFKYAAVDFLVKPFGGKELQAAVEKVAKQQEPLQNLEQLNLLIDYLRTPQHQNDRLAITLVGGKLQMIELAEVLFLKSNSSMTYLYLKGHSQPIAANKNLGQYVEILQKDTRFFSISNSLLINLEYLYTYDHGEQLVKLKHHTQALYASRQGGQRLRQHLFSNQPISPAKTESLKGFFKKLLGKK